MPHKNINQKKHEKYKNPSQGGSTCGSHHCRGHYRSFGSHRHSRIRQTRATSQANACINDLRQIDAAAQEIALEKGKTRGPAITYPMDLTPASS